MIAMVLFLSFGTTSTTIKVSSRCPRQTNPEEQLNMHLTEWLASVIYLRLPLLTNWNTGFETETLIPHHKSSKHSPHLYLFLFARKTSDIYLSIALNFQEMGMFEAISSSLIEA